MGREFAVLSLAWAVLAVSGCVRISAPPTPAGPDARAVRFSDREWIVRPSGRGESPGPNDWSDRQDSVWVDDRGLHLAITKQSGVWHAVEVSTALPPEAVHVAATLETPLDALDPRAVAAVFVYRDDTHEADIEFSRWGRSGSAPNTQFAVAPYGADQRHRFRLPGDLAPTEHVLDWRVDRVAFHSRSEQRVLEEWRHTDAHWHDRDGYRLIVNLWLYQGRQPLTGQPTEVVFSAITIE